MPEQDPGQAADQPTPDAADAPDEAGTPEPTAAADAADASADEVAEPEESSEKPAEGAAEESAEGSDAEPGDEAAEADEPAAEDAPEADAADEPAEVAPEADVRDDEERSSGSPDERLPPAPNSTGEADVERGTPTSAAADGEAVDAETSAQEPDEPGEDTPAAEVGDAGPADEPGPSDAAADEKPEDEKPEDEKPATGRQRLADALLHVRRGQAIVAALLCVLGFAAVLQVRTNDQDNSYDGQREQDLIDILSGLAGTTQKAQEQLSSLQRTRSDLESETSKQQAALDRAQQQVDTLRVMAGTTPVKGPGVIITVEPGPDVMRLTPVLDLIEELRTNGAEAIDVNGKVRLVASTPVEVSQNVTGLVVEGQLVRPPYRFHAIGAPETLKGAIDIYRGPEDELKAEGAKVHVTTSENIEIKAVHTPSH